MNPGIPGAGSQPAPGIHVLRRIGGFAPTHLRPVRVHRTGGRGRRVLGSRLGRVLPAAHGVRVRRGRRRRRKVRSVLRSRRRRRDRRRRRTRRRRGCGWRRRRRRHLLRGGLLPVHEPDHEPLVRQLERDGRCVRCPAPGVGLVRAVVAPHDEPAHEVRLVVVGHVHVASPVPRHRELLRTGRDTAVDDRRLHHPHRRQAPVGDDERRRAGDLHLLDFLVRDEALSLQLDTLDDCALRHCAHVDGVAVVLDADGLPVAPVLVEPDLEPGRLAPVGRPLDEPDVGQNGGLLPGHRLGSRLLYLPVAVARDPVVARRPVVSVALRRRALLAAHVHDRARAVPDVDLHVPLDAVAAGGARGLHLLRLGHRDGDLHEHVDVPATQVAAVRGEPLGDVPVLADALARRPDVRAGRL